MTIHKQGITPIALCILVIFVLNALIQFYHPHANTFKWVVYILSFIAFIFTVLIYITLKDGRPLLPEVVRNLFFQPTPEFKDEQREG